MSWGQVGTLGAGMWTCLSGDVLFPASARCLGLPRTQTFGGSVNLESMLFASVLCSGIRKQPV
jgi:hypothetical protein